MSKSTLLSSEELPAATVLNKSSDAPILFVCDHSSNRVPNSLSKLGLSSEQLQQHIAWDRGTAELAQALNERLAYRMVMCNYSRLVIDCNRQQSDETLVCVTSDQIPIPGNQNLSAQQHDARVKHIYQPYHQAISQELDDLQTIHQAPAIISLHSFTPQLRGQEKRPWHVGLLWDKDQRLAEHFIEYFAAFDDLCVGENLPYSGKDVADYTIDHHGEDRGIACLSIEVRQDLLADTQGVSIWAEHIANVVKTIRKDQRVFTMQ